MDAIIVAVMFCLNHGGQEANNLRALMRERDGGALPSGEAEGLIENYRQLRRVEAILRRWSFEGKTVLPDDEAPYYRVSIRCGFSGPAEFRRGLAKYRRAICAVYYKALDK